MRKIFYSLILFLMVNLSFAQSGNWENFVYPEVEVIVKNVNGKGQKGVDIVNRLLVNVDSVAKSICLGVCKKLYKSVDEVPSFTKLNYVLEYRDGLAYKSGNPPEITINFSTKYVESLANQNDAAAKYELEGVFWHELTHAYQYNPVGAGGYTAGTDYYGFIEGMADFVRINSGYHKTRKPSNGHWTDGYTTTGFFFNWLVENHNSDFMYKFNQTARQFNPWSFETATREILGRGIQSLWNEYIHHINGGNGEPVADFDIDKVFVGANKIIKISDNSYNNPEVITWFIDNVKYNPETDPFELSFDEEGEHRVKLEISNDKGSSSITKNIYVIEASKNIFEFSTMENELTAQYNDSPNNEKVQNLFDDNVNTKFLTFHNSAWVQFKTNFMFRLVGYSISSANDAPERDPKNWVIKGSNDGITWEFVDEKTGEDFSKRYQTNNYLATTSWNGYKMFRIEFENNSGNILQLSELKLFGYADKTTGIEEYEVPYNFTLDQNYPNPFNPETNISFSVGKSGNYKLEILSLAGELIQVIADENFYEGKYNVQFNASKLASGIYVYRLSGMGNTVSKKMLLVK